MAAGLPDQSAVMAVLDAFKDPETGRSAVQMGQLSDVQITADGLSLTLALTTHSAVLWEETKIALEQLLRSKFPQLKSAAVNLAVHARPPQKLGSIGLTAKSVIAV